MYDVIIIGGGVTGLGAAWYLTEYLKKSTLLLEQFPFPHQFGSSAGHSRITRQLYGEYFNCNLMKEATKMWQDLQEKSGLDLFIPSGLITFGNPGTLDKYTEAINISGISAHVISREEAKHKFPAFNISGDNKIIFDPVAGVLRADRCLKALMDQSVKHGLQFHEMEKVTAISVISDKEVAITTNKGQYRSKSVIIASGIWSKKMLEELECQLPLQAVKIHYAYFHSTDAADSLYNYGQFPSFIFTDSDVYGCSGEEYPGCLKIGDFNSDNIDPDKRDSDCNDCQSKELFLKNVQSFLKQFIPSADITPANITTCVITRTPDDKPIIDRHSKYKNVIIGCGFCGSGFKTGVIHGKMLANFAVEQNNNYEMQHFSVSRFL